MASRFIITSLLLGFVSSDPVARTPPPSICKARAKQLLTMAGEVPAGSIKLTKGDCVFTVDVSARQVSNDGLRQRVTMQVFAASDGSRWTIIDDNMYRNFQNKNLVELLAEVTDAGELTFSVVAQSEDIRYSYTLKAEKLPCTGQLFTES